MGGLSLPDGCGVLTIVVIGAERGVGGEGLQTTTAGFGVMLAASGHFFVPFWELGFWGTPGFLGNLLMGRGLGAISR